MQTIPLTVTVAEVPTLRFTLTDDIPAGGFLRVRASSVQMLMSLSVSEIRVEGDNATLPIVHRFAAAEMRRDWSWHIRTLSLAVAQTAKPIARGAVLQVAPRYGSEAVSRRSRPMSYSGLDWEASLGLIQELRSQEFREAAKPWALRLTAGEPIRLEAYLKPDGRLLLTYFDALGNPAAEPEGEAEVIANGTARKVRTSTSRATEPISVGKAAPECPRIEVKDNAGRETVANACPFAMDGTPVYFGEFHWHTDFSGDGQRRMEAALRSSRDELGLDFAGPADHMGANGRYRDKTPLEQAEICRRFDEPGRFCTLPGAEVSRRYGHANLHTDSFETLLETTARFETELAPKWRAAPNRYGFDALVPLCPPGKALVIPHHSNMDSNMQEGVVAKDGRPAWCAMHWPIPADRTVVRLIEIVQGRGCFEAEQPDEAWRIGNGGLGGSARTALMRGYRVGFVGGTDNHCGWPTREGAGYCGLTAVQSRTLKTRALFDALHSRRCYATSGARIVADCTLNGLPMGSESTLEPGAERRFRIRIRGTAPLTAVQLIHFGCVLADFDVGKDSLDFETEWVDDRPGRPLQDAYYYVRARQADGHCAWLSPFWIDLPR